MTSSRDGRRTILLLALGCALLLPHIPLVNLLCYPLTLLVTSIHEMGHALAALLTGGSVTYIEIFRDGSGLTYSRGGIFLAVASAGYVGSTVFGCVLLILAQRPRLHRIVLIGLIVFFAAFTFFARNAFALCFGLIVLVGLWAMIRTMREPNVLYFLFDFIGLNSCLYSLHHFIFLISSSLGWARVGGPLGKTDAQILGEATPIPAILWALGWAAISALAAWWALRATWHEIDGAAEAPPADPPPPI